MSIPHCKVHTDDFCLTCESCALGYELSIDSQYCDMTSVNLSSIAPLPVQPTYPAQRTQPSQFSRSVAPFEPTCSPQQYSSMLKCFDLGPNCLTYDSSGACITCYPQQALQKGICLPTADRFVPCAVMRGDECLRCNVKALMVRPGYCQQSEEFCTKFDLRTGQCIRCKGRYLLRANFCLRIAEMAFDYVDDHCSEWYAGKCYRCEAGWSTTAESPCQQDKVRLGPSLGAGTPTSPNDPSASSTTEQTAAASGPIVILKPLDIPPKQSQ